MVLPLLMAGTSLGLTGTSIFETSKAKKEAKKQQRLQNTLLAQQKAEALQRRKSLIDQQRYNLLGSIDNGNNTLG